MNFFEKIKEDLEKGIEDMTTVEHALIQKNEEKSELLLYRKQEIDGDSIVFHTSKALEPEIIEAFNKAFQASITSRIGILSALIKIFNN